MQTVRFTPIPWEMLPDLGLYMDQVITLIERHFASYRGPDASRALTPAMINNYVKSGLIPRPSGKKYDRAQLAMLIMVATLKQVASMEDIAKLISVEGSSAEALYTAFLAAQVQAAEAVSREMAEGNTSALQFAVQAAARSLASETLLKREGGEPVAGGKKRKDAE